MPKRQDINKILIIGAGPIIIGQACEFDYSGVQACKALKEEGYEIILVNSNPATIMTDPDLADSTYIEPIEKNSLIKIIEIERPDAILPTMGGQTSLNCALELAAAGVLDKYNIELIGANADSIDKAENRERFATAMRKIGLDMPKSGIARNLEEAFELEKEIGFPLIIRPSFTLGGTGGGVAYNIEELEDICKNGLNISPTKELLIEESIAGWKEFEMEVIRDKKDNAIIVCSIENFDPMGIHTGDSITVAPAQTLTDKEYQRMRDASLAVIREIGVETGGSNVQFAVNPDDGRLIVIEMNPRVSRSSALASKATGFPIAKVAAKLAVGYTLDELDNDITGGKMPASFEPTLDYVVTKIPRFSFDKFPQTNSRLTTQMKSVGEVMAIGSNFSESLQKAIRGLEIDKYGFEEILSLKSYDPDAVKNTLRQELIKPSEKRLWYIADAFRFGWSIQEVHDCCKIDPWFLSYIEQIVKIEEELKEKNLDFLLDNAGTFFEIKKLGFADKRIAKILKTDENAIRTLRKTLNIKPVYKRIDSCAGEFDSITAYMYSTYQQECEANPTNNKKIIVLGGGPNRIGQGIEFDYCCVHACFALRELGYETIMVNCNPETVSTDYDTADRLYFESITFEDVMSIINQENPLGVIVQYGGQTPLKLANQLKNAGVPILGTSVDSIDLAEDRERFAEIVNKLNLKQPINRIARTTQEAIILSKEVKFPLVVRPSYVLGGRAMEIVYSEEDLEHYMNESVHVSPDTPILLDSYLNNAIELDIDAVGDGENITIGAVMQHIEQAGVHSGDSACSLPPYSVPEALLNKVRQQVIALGKAINVKGLMNAQVAIQDEEVYILEVNPRASRTIPFVSKAINKPLAKIGAKAMVGVSLKQQNFIKEIKPKKWAAKEAVFPFVKFLGVDPILGPEMKSTGETMGIGNNFYEAYSKAILAAGIILPKSGSVVISVRKTDMKMAIEVAKILRDLDFKIFATKGTARNLNEAGIDTEVVNKVKEGRPHIVDMIKNKEVHLIINTADTKDSITDSFDIRREALTNQIVTTTTLSGATALAHSIKYIDSNTPIKIQAIT